MTMVVPVITVFVSVNTVVAVPSRSSPRSVRRNSPSEPRHHGANHSLMP